MAAEPSPDSATPADAGIPGAIPQPPSGEPAPEAGPAPEPAGPAAGDVPERAAAGRPTGPRGPVPPDVTVVVIVHNDAERLPRAVESVRRQTLRELEIVISDDHSTDRTPAVARALAAADDRIRYHRLPRNSGGCGTPRNAAVELSSAPFLMFLDSDDELPPDACAALLDVLQEDDDADFAMGAVERVTPGGVTGTWRPHLVDHARTVRGLRSEPGLLHNPLATDKMYRRAFLDRHGLRFPPGLRHADQLFATRAYARARAIAILSTPVYRWHVARPAPAPRAARDTPPARATATTADATPAATPGEAPAPAPVGVLDVVRDRIAVHRLTGEALDEAGLGELRAENDYALLTRDIAPWVAELPHRGEEFTRAFAMAVNDCLETVRPAARERAPRDLRVTLALLRAGRYAEAAAAARCLGLPVAPRETVRAEDGTEYWGAVLPADPHAAAELATAELALDTRPLAGALLRHEVVALTPNPASRIALRIRTYDPGRRLATGPVLAAVLLDPADREHRTEFRLDQVRPGVLEGEAELDLTAAPLPAGGFTGLRTVRVVVGRGNVTTPAGPLLAPVGMPRMSKAVGYHRGLTPHLVTVAAETPAGLLTVGWARTGLLAAARRRLPDRPGTTALAALRRAARRPGRPD